MTTGQQIGLMSNWQTYTFYHPQNTGKPRLYFAQQDTFLVVLVYCSCIKWHVFGSVCIAFRFACLKHLHLYIGQWYQRSLIKTSTLVHYTRGLSLVNEITFDRFSSPRWPVGDLPWSPVCTRNIISGQEHLLWPHHVKPPPDLESHHFQHRLETLEWVLPLPTQTRNTRLSPTTSNTDLNTSMTTKEIRPGNGSTLVTSCGWNPAVTIVAYTYPLRAGRRCR